MRNTLLATLLSLAVPAGMAQAAAILIDDSDPSTVTISANDFEGGFSVGGTLVQSGLNNPASITLPDGSYILEGRFIDLGQSTGVQNTILFALVPGVVTSGLEFGVTTDGSIGTLGGSLGSFTGGVYFNALPTFAQGTTQDSAVPFLTVQFISEAAPIPAPAALGLFGFGLAGLLVARRQRG